MATKVLKLIAILSLSILAVSCASTDTANTNSNSADNSTAPTTTAAPDNSEVITTNTNGVRTQTRTFRDNPRVSKVVVTTRDGKTTAKAYSPSGEEREMSAPEKALDATGEAIADSVGWVKDKGGDVVDKTKDTGKTVGEKTVEGTEKVVNKTTDTAKTVGSKTKEGAETVVDKTATGVKKTGKAIKKVIPH